jgi:RNA polymerase sigma-70 factor (ECF subfamily)
MRAGAQRAAVVEITHAADDDLDLRFAAFVRTHRDKAWRLAWRLVGGDDAAADDVTQDALVRAYRGLARFREEAKLETWFFRILVRQAHNYRRWRALRELWTGGGGGEDVAGAQETGGDPLLRKRIARALGALTSPQREAFVQVHLEGFTVREAADIMAKPEGTVKSHLQRALKSLRAELDDLR